MFRRKLKRRHLIYYLRVFDQASGALVGHIADITTEGFMLVSEAPMATERAYRLVMKLPLHVEHDDEYKFDATCIWCKPDTNPSFFVSGFSLVERGPELRGGIEYLIQEIGFND